MSTHLAKHRAEMEKQAYPAVERLLEQNPKYTIDADQSGSQSVTNYVIFGHRGEQPVVFKYFCEDERKDREVYALHHFAATDVVPQLLHEHGSRLIVQSRIPGRGFPQPGDPAFATVDVQSLGYTLGRATAKLLSAPLTAQAALAFERRFYDALPLEQYFRTILDASWSIHETVDCYQGALFRDSLREIEENLPFILGQDRLIYHQDALNMHFMENRFTGFFDLEMCRVGTEAMQIGSLWYIFAIFDAWQPFAQGFASLAERELGQRDLAAGRAFAHFLVWRYISRSGRWRGEPRAKEADTQIEADAAAYARSIELNYRAG